MRQRVGVCPGVFRAVCLAGGLAVVALPRPARAAEDAPIPAEPAVRRQGWALGVSTGLSLSSARGYPNDVTKIDLPEFEASTGAGVSSAGGFWLGKALVDWLTVGLGFTVGGFKGNALNASGYTVHIHVEAFPLFYRGGFGQDLGVAFMAGMGGLSLERGNETVAEGEGTSVVGLGAFYEPWRFWHFSTGPDLQYTHQFSRSMSGHQLVLGWRLAFYGGP
jgi:hypothetical protein